MVACNDCLQQESHRLGHALGNLQRDVAHESIAYQHVGLAVEQVAAFDVAHEIQRQFLDQLEGFLGQLVALGFFFADGEHAHARMLGGRKAVGKNRAEIHVAHDGELLQILRLGIDVGAHVDQDGRRALRGRENRRQRRTIHSGQRAQHHLGGGHARAGIAGADEPGGLAFAHQAQSHAHRGVALGAHRLRRLLVHANHFPGMNNPDRQTLPQRMELKFLADELFLPNQQHLHVIVTGSEYRTIDFGFGRLVGAHRVNGNCG